MPDYTITITAVEEGVLESFYPTADDGIQYAARRLVRTLAKKILYEDTTSILDPRKMSDQELRDELLAHQSEVPTYEERYPPDPEPPGDDPV